MARNAKRIGGRLVEGEVEVSVGGARATIRLYRSNRGWRWERSRQSDRVKIIPLSKEQADETLAKLRRLTDADKD